MPPIDTVVGVYETRISESSAQNKPDGAFEPPRTGRPFTIFVEATVGENFPQEFAL